MEPASTKTQQLAFLQIFRAFAAGMVAIGHFSQDITIRIPAYRDSIVLSNLQILHFGVDLFFIISGFIMVYTTHNDAGGTADASRFFIRRLIRIVPVYWFYATLYIAAALLVLSVSLSPQFRDFATRPAMRALVVISDTSYSLYLSHMFVMRAMPHVIPLWLGLLYPAVFVISSMLVTIVVAYLSFILFERPVHEWGKRTLASFGSQKNSRNAKQPWMAL